MNIEIKTTSDGSSTLYRPDLNEHYHSINGAITESMHVYIGAGLNNCHSNPVHILEMGFGTGLNALLTIVNQTSQTIVYHAVEKHPVDDKITESVNYPDLLNSSMAKPLFRQLHSAPWNICTSISDAFIIKKTEEDIHSFESDVLYNLVYFDAFAPDIQPELWTKDLFSKIWKMMDTKGILTTYCAKGVVRRNMQSAGFEVERLAGPPGKREMLRATKP
ncbi:tRNA (5-methylaminomethyl-2-thiouridine)(34)-methyltransferase MnmD [Alkalitalea saponilacus]|uniref:tRNA U34 5-methylaminomethyl-2-thiouridine-forming methyltransferase MnmC n=1 Tax=Alkalitalea saponilacus TaxID=889453 RepID=A0A1T5G4A6_9BACT|nr:tRNA (5-methylaminomethyl-2-thiouridine)(34)-methyltransferase MnmD [Alkalitalea saponilacus]ASB47851.1 SAM-dependent methyltransferase [Alkalitalea saponilacus]SKC03256.1 tRNA U34 5-methylaminomethyl-2-thiouridine-forming methyltransferase MnmC [Alkalitalea saponilacus]